MSGAGPTVIRTQPSRPNSLPGRMSNSAAQEALGQSQIVHADVGEDEIGLGRKNVRPRGLNPSASAVRAEAFSRRLDSTSSSRLQARATGRERGPVDVERLLHDVEVGRERLVCKCVAEPEPGQPENLRERPQQEHGPPGLDVLLAQKPPRGLDELHVGLVDDDGASLGERVEERLPLVPSASDPVGLFGSQSQTSRA